MLAYLILTGRDGAPVDEGLIASFDVDDPAEVPFHPAERIVWRNEDGRTVFFGWQAFTGVAGMGAHWAVDERGLTAFAGHCWPKETGWDHGSGMSWAEQLQRFLGDQPDLLAAREALYGHFCLITLPNQGAGAVVSDFANMHELFFAEHATVACISNRAGLCARAVATPGASPRRSLTGAGWLIGEGWPLDNESGYWDVERPPFGTHVSIDPWQGARVLELPRSPLLAARESADSSGDAALDDIERDLRFTIRAIADLPVPDREFGLSGGKDSRMLLGIILSEGLADRFRFVTQGSPERADVRVAEMIATRFGLDWRREDQDDRSAEHELENVRWHTGLVEGMTSAWSASASYAFTPGVSLTGIGGENLRPGVMETYCGAGARTATELVATMQKRHVFDRLGIMRPAASAYYRRFLTEWVDDQTMRGSSLDSISAIYTYGLLGYTRNAPVCTWSERMRLNPFVTPVCARFRPEVDRRQAKRFSIDLIRRCHVDLGKLPLAGDSWLEEEIGHLPDAEEYRRVDPIASESPAASTWRVRRYADYQPMLESILLDPGNPIYELLVTDRVVDRIATGDAHPGRTRLIWGLLTAAIWMGHHELPGKIVPPAVG